MVVIEVGTEASEEKEYIFLGPSWIVATWNTSQYSGCELKPSKCILIAPVFSWVTRLEKV